MKECGKSIELVAPASRRPDGRAECPPDCRCCHPSWRKQNGVIVLIYASCRASLGRTAEGCSHVVCGSQPASRAPNTSTRIPTTIRYTANGTNPRFLTQAMKNATDA
jgi:hypothetical protein